MRKISAKGKKIIKLIEDGLTKGDIRKLGYKREIVRYHWRRIKNPEKYREFVAKIQQLNKLRCKK